MIDLVSALQVILQAASYRTRLMELETFSVVCFEDDAIMGFACLFEVPATLLQRWRSIETALLARFAPSLREAGDKSWNVYCAFLSGAPVDAMQAREVKRIEEDIERTRKIAACNLISREDLIRAFLPILPLQYQPIIDAEEIGDRLRRRIETIAPGAVALVLDESVPPIEVVRLLGDRT